jgi:hypothetical protein
VRASDHFAPLAPGDGDRRCVQRLVRGHGIEGGRRKRFRWGGWRWGLYYGWTRGRRDGRQSQSRRARRGDGASGRRRTERCDRMAP